MISSEITSFLTELSQNNHKLWFDENRTRYKKVKSEFEDLVNRLIVAISSFDPTITGIAVKDCTFRINKDIRFSSDKRPYKTNLGAYIVKGGKKSGAAGYYIHIEPGNSFAGGGVYCPEPARLKLVREAIYNDSESFLAIINNPEFKGIYSEIYGESLKKAPRGFDADFPQIELIKLKSYTAIQSISDADLHKNSQFEKVVKAFMALHPFNDYLNKALEY